jgi:hypothetical protein
VQSGGGTMIDRPRLLALTKLHPDDTRDDIAARLGDPAGYDHLPVASRALARVRDEIALCDAVLAARAAVAELSRHYVDDELPEDDAVEELDVVRLKLLVYLDDVEAAIGHGERLLAGLRLRTGAGAAMRRDDEDDER